MANEPLRLRILQALTSHLEGITGEPFYHYSLKGKIYRGKTVFGADIKPPFVSIIEGQATDYGSFADENQSIRKDSWLLLVQGFVADDSRNPTDPAYRLCADVESRMGDIVALDNKGQPKFPGVYNLNGLISSLTIAAPVVRPPEDGLSSTAFFYLPVLVGLKTDLS